MIAKNQNIINIVYLGSVIPGEGFFPLRSIGCKICFRKLSPLFSLKIKELTIFSPGIAVRFISSLRSAAKCGILSSLIVGGRCIAVCNPAEFY